MEAKAQARFVRIAPRKARAVADLIRKLHVDDAITILNYTPRRAAQILSKVVLSAAANAENNLELKRDGLYVEQVYVDEGPTYKRVQARARGCRFMIRKRTSHITVIVKQRKEG